MAALCGLGRQQAPVQARAVCGEHVDAFVQVPVRRGSADRIIRRQLRHPGVPSRNQRNRSTAWARQPSARRLPRVPRRWRSACSRLDRNSTVSSRAQSTAVYATLVATQDPY